MAISMNMVFPIALIAAFTVNANTENPTIATMASISFLCCGIHPSQPLVVKE